MKVNPLALSVALALARFTTATHAQEAPAAAQAASTPEASAVAPDTWRLMMSPLTVHFSYDPNHRYVYMLGLERERADGLVMGAAYFRNSFGQPSGYVYAGHRFSRVAGYDPFFVEVNAGLLYGYVAPFNHKVPFDSNGFSPGALVSAGWKFTPTLAGQVNLLGLAAVMFQLSADF
jgi:hypothetical protein